MRLIYYLNEEVDIDDVFRSIKKDCKPWIKASKGEVAYRGMRTDKGNFFRRKTRTDRQPLDTPQEISDAFDSAAKAKYGWKPRSEGMFCVGEKDVARAYGLVYSVWPIGSFKFLWSDRIEDFTNEYEDADPDVVRMNAIQHYSNKNLDKAIRRGSEIMVKCKEYYAVFDFFLSLGAWAAKGYN